MAVCKHPDREAHQMCILPVGGCGVASIQQMHAASLLASGRIEQMRLARGCSAVRAPGCWEHGLGSVRSPDAEVTQDAWKR